MILKKCVNLIVKNALNMTTPTKRTLKTLKIFSTESLLSVIGALLIWFYQDNKANQITMINQQKEILDKLNCKVAKNTQDIAVIKERLKMPYNE